MQGKDDLRLPRQDPNQIFSDWPNNLMHLIESFLTARLQNESTSRSKFSRNCFPYSPNLGHTIQELPSSQEGEYVFWTCLLNITCHSEFSRYFIPWSPY